MYNAIDLSKYIVSKCVIDGHPISNLQLQKILYYIQKDFLQRDEVAFSDNIEAWQLFLMYIIIIVVLVLCQYL